MVTNTTIGVDCHNKKLNTKIISIESMIWDTGQERYNSIISTYYRHANGVFLI